MKASKSGKTFRCAIYTRKSTEHGLELEFNSLDAQREACEAYIKSQASEGWQVLVRKYDDPAFSGGNMERPALQRLLKDIESGLIDVIVVYKIDRLTRSLADFAKLVEVFDDKSVSFVAVTQQFNTTTSMGRLTLNVLLSFAQFERELSSERVRDKVAASRKKGKWMGGSVPLGYDSEDKKLVINQSEAKTVQMIFERYLALKSFQKLVDELNQKGIVTKTRQVQGTNTGGVSFTYGPLAYLLKNRTYLGETGHDGSWFSGEHQAIVDRGTFDQVQQLLKSNSAGRTGERRENSALLTGLIFDDRGNRMSPSFTVKRGVRYRSYVSTALLKGRKAAAGSVSRVSAKDVEDTVINAVHERAQFVDETSLTPQNIIATFVDRVTVGSEKLTITIKNEGAGNLNSIDIPWSKPKKHIIRRTVTHDRDLPRPDPNLVHSIVRAHMWVHSLELGTYDSVEDLARSVELNPKVVRKRIRLAFLAPDIVKATLRGERQRATLADLNHVIPLSWNEQRSILETHA